MGEETSGMYGASAERMLSQSMPLKKAWPLKSEMPLRPSRRSREQSSRWIRSLASSETSVTWEGNWKRSWKPDRKSGPGDEQKERETSVH